MTSQVLLFVFRLFPENYEHADEHSLWPHHVTLHVVVVVAGSGSSTAQVSEDGRGEGQRLTLSKELILSTK